MENHKPPIFIIGRQHSGNTMLATILDNHPDVMSFKGEGNFFDKFSILKKEAKHKLPGEIAKIIQESQSPPLKNKKAEKLENYLTEKFSNESSPAQLYIEGMNKLAKENNTKVWAQKATSYIFHAKEILKNIPKAKLIYLSRNPLDLGASFKKRHGGSKDWFIRMAIGWNKGGKLALKYKFQYPNRFKIVKYEKLIQNSQKEIEKVFNFLNLNFKEKYLDVPHVNKAEDPYNKNSKEKGVQRSKIFYYPNVLSPGEEKFIRLLVNNKALKKLYPNLPPQTEGSALGVVKDLGLSFLSGTTHILKDTLNRGVGRYIKRILR